MPQKLTETPTHTSHTLQEGATHREVTLQPDGPRETPTRKKRSVAGKVLLLLALLVCVGAFISWRSSTKKTQAASAAQADAQSRRAVPVVTSVAEKRDLPVYLEGLGSVTAFNTVTVKSRVDGELTEIHFKEGQDVKKGDLLAVIDPRPFEVALSQAQATLSRDQAQLSDAKLDAGRYSQLVKEGVIAQQQYDTQNALAGQVQGSVEADQAQIDNAKLNLVYSHITSPIDGRVGLRLVDAGNIVHAADASGLLVITQMQPISVIFTLPEDSLPSVNGGMHKGTLQVRALSRDDGKQLALGTLLTIDNQIDQTTGTYRLKAVFSNEDRALWPNQFVNARLLLDTKKNAILVPAAAVQHGSQGAFVYVVKPDKTAETRTVTPGITEGTITEITAGIAAGELVVTDGQDKLRAGTPVDARPDTRNGAPNAAAGGNAGPSSTPFLGGGANGSNPQGNPAAGAQSNQAGGQQGAQGGGQRSGGNGQKGIVQGDGEYQRQRKNKNQNKNPD
jgi:membrane fusion protein, multidrug efflux system